MFFEKIDSVTGDRDENIHSGSNNACQQIITEMNLLKDVYDKVYVIGATNRPSKNRHSFILNCM